VTDVKLNEKIISIISNKNSTTPGRMALGEEKGEGKGGHKNLLFDDDRRFLYYF
jgi:hypothetical protein